MKKSMVIWSTGKDWGAERSYLIPAGEIELSALVAENTLRIGNVDVLKVDMGELDEQLNAYIERKEENEENFDYDITSMEEFLQSTGYENAEVSWIDGYVQKKDALLYDTYNKGFCNLADYEDEKTYQWHDGSNWVRLVCDEEMTETEIEITEASVCLDEWDGSNMVTGGMALHEYIHKVITVDGKEVQDTYLLHESSQWQDKHDEGKIMDTDEIKQHLQEIKRDVEEYMPDIYKLAGE